jgi:HAD superfamily hydrolase (TIGR01490 family)
VVDIQQIAAFDLDGTLVSGQTQAMLVHHLASRRMLSASTLTAVAVWFAKYRFGMPVEHKRIRLRVMRAFAGHSVESVDRIIDEVYAERVAPRLRLAGRRALRALEDAGVRTVIVSAAPEPLVSRVAVAIGATGFVATRLEKDLGYYTGRIEGPVIEGSHKMSALNDWAARRYQNWTLKAAFGDHASDAPIMHAAHEAYAVCPDRGLRALAETEGWNILDWSECPPLPPQQAQIRGV